MMNTRYRVTRNPNGDLPENKLSLAECKAYFETQADFTYEEEYSARSETATMKIKGDFFMWHVGDIQVPFRYYEGDLYVAVSHEEIFRKMVEVADRLNAQYVEG